MAQKYKIFLNEKLLTLEHQTESIKREKFQLISSPAELIYHVHQLNSNNDLKELHLISSIPLNELIPLSLKIVKAAGGLVFNNTGQLLFIKRYTLWDLPKGKLNKNESFRDCALREVSEETGLKELRIVEAAGTTYHIYHHNFRYHLKKTLWYRMEYTGSETPVPQVEESITEVQWFGPEERTLILKNTYNSLKALTKEYFRKSGL